MPDLPPFGDWLRRTGSILVRVLDELLRRRVHSWWRKAGVPEQVILLLDSTVRVRCGKTQVGAERGCNPKKPSRSSHHLLLAFLIETGACLGVLTAGLGLVRKRRHRVAAQVGGPIPGLALPDLWPVSLACPRDLPTASGHSAAHCPASRPAASGCYLSARGIVIFPGGVRLQGRSQSLRRTGFNSRPREPEIPSKQRTPLAVRELAGGALMQWE